VHIHIHQIWYAVDTEKYHGLRNNTMHSIYALRSSAVEGHLLKCNGSTDVPTAL